jgi:hypothetical protein
MHCGNRYEYYAEMMSHISQVSLDELTGLDLLPLGCLSISADDLGKQGIWFQEETDDLDVYKIAALRLERPAVCTIALRAYRGGPAGVVDVLMPASLAGTPAVDQIVGDTVLALGLQADVTRWPAAKAAAISGD